MITNYKSFLINKMEKHIEEISNSINEDSHYYYNFIDDELFGIVESECHTFLIILNSYKDISLEIKQRISDYKRAYKHSIKMHISPKSFRKLIKRGLYMSLESGKSNIDNLFSIQRLTKCIEENIVGKVVHHIDSDSLNNNITNLKAMYESEHEEITRKNRNNRRYKYEEYITL